VVLVLGGDELPALGVGPALPTAGALAGLGASLDDPEHAALATADDGVHASGFRAVGYERLASCDDSPRRTMAPSHHPRLCHTVPSVETMEFVQHSATETVEAVEGVHLTQLAVGEEMSVQHFHIE